EHPKEGKPSYIIPVSRHRFHQPHRQGRPREGSKVTARLNREPTTMAENIRNITQQNLAMQELLKNIHARERYSISPYTAQKNASF
ncbi:Hypothetical predicted protein, partial [Olea europaea subsp. europaea]